MQCEGGHAGTEEGHAGTEEGHVGRVGSLEEQTDLQTISEDTGSSDSGRQGGGVRPELGGETNKALTHLDFLLVGHKINATCSNADIWGKWRPFCSVLY